MTFWGKNWLEKASRNAAICRYFVCFLPLFFCCRDRSLSKIRSFAVRTMISRRYCRIAALTFQQRSYSDLIFILLTHFLHLLSFKVLKRTNYHILKIIKIKSMFIKKRTAQISRSFFFCIILLSWSFRRSWIFWNICLSP